MNGEQWIIAIGLICSTITGAVTIIMQYFTKRQGQDHQKVVLDNQHELKHELAANTTKTEQVEKAVNGSLDAKIVMAIQLALEEGIAKGVEQERQRQESVKDKLTQAWINAQKKTDEPEKK
jgi:hypothetical protein